MNKIYYILFFFFSGIFVFFFNLKSLMIILISIEYMMLMLISIIFFLFNFMYLDFFFIMMFIMFMVTESVVGLSLLISMIRKLGNENLNLIFLFKF